MHYLFLALCVLVPLWMSFVSRTAGGGYIADKIPSPLPEILFGLSIGVGSYFLIGTDITVLGYIIPQWFLGLVAGAWSYVSMEHGHGNAYHMGTLQYQYPPRHQGLDVIVLPICRIFGWESRSTPYCWLFMGLKGLLIGLPLGWYGLPLAVLWPVAYWYSFTRTQSSEYAEHISGAFAGILLEIVLITHI